MSWRGKTLLFPSLFAIARAAPRPPVIDVSRPLFPGSSGALERALASLGRAVEQDAKRKAAMN